MEKMNLWTMEEVIKVELMMIAMNCLIILDESNISIGASSDSDIDDGDDATDNTLALYRRMISNTSFLSQAASYA